MCTTYRKFSSLGCIAINGVCSSCLSLRAHSEDGSHESDKVDFKYNKADDNASKVNFTIHYSVATGPFTDEFYVERKLVR